MKYNNENENENEENNHAGLFGGKFKVECRNCGLIGHKEQRL
jgi:hypothetical protein